jgi:hypothetical protein
MNEAVQHESLQVAIDRRFGRSEFTRELGSNKLSERSTVAVAGPGLSRWIVATLAMFHYMKRCFKKCYSRMPTVSTHRSLLPRDPLQHAQAIRDALPRALTRY